MVANIFPFTPHPPDPAGGVKRSKFNFLEHGCVAYQIKWNHHECSNMVTNILFADPYHLSRPLGWGQWVEIQPFQNMIIKCSNMVANILPPDPIGQNLTFPEYGHIELN